MATTHPFARGLCNLAPGRDIAPGMPELRRMKMPNEHSRRGFGAMSEEKQREIASKGGKASHGGQGKEGKSAGSRGGSHEQHVRAGEQSHKHR